MNVLIDIAHPAHIHYFRNFAKIFESKGHTCLFTLRDKGIIVELAKYYKLNYRIRSIEGKSKVIYMFNSFKNVFKISKNFKPDIYIDAGTVISAPISKLFNKTYIALEDTEAATKAVRIFKPFAENILTPNCFYKDLGKKQIKFNGLLELLYLNEKYFNKDVSQIRSFISNVNNYILIRFVSWEAHHDVGKKGISYENKVKLINYLKKNFKIVISSEGELPDEFKEYQVKFPSYLMHQAISHAKFIITEGATMASEAAVLGTPTIYINTIQNGYTNEQMQKRLIWSLSNDGKLFEVIKEVESLISDNNEMDKYRNRYQDYLNEKIDMTAFLVWFIENYPKSKAILMNNSEFQNRFKL
jgi:uncharacterized protein